jgi:hypothetical protein
MTKLILFSQSFLTSHFKCPLVLAELGSEELVLDMETITEMPDASGRGAKLLELKVECLEGHFFGGVTNSGNMTTSSNSYPCLASVTSDHHHGDGSSGGGSSSGGELQTTVGNRLAF